MGARVTEKDRRLEGGEWVADLIVVPSRLAATRVSEAQVPAMVDELPLLACVAARAEGETVITGAGELRVKESDRIAAVVANLQAIGATAEELPDGMRIVGSDRSVGRTSQDLWRSSIGHGLWRAGRRERERHRDR